MSVLTFAFSTYKKLFCVDRISRLTISNIWMDSIEPCQCLLYMSPFIPDALRNLVFILIVVSHVWQLGFRTSFDASKIWKIDICWMTQKRFKAKENLITKPSTKPRSVVLSRRCREKFDKRKEFSWVRHF